MVALSDKSKSKPSADNGCLIVECGSDEVSVWWRFLTLLAG